MFFPDWLLSSEQNCGASANGSSWGLKGGLSPSFNSKQAGCFPGEGDLSSRTSQWHGFPHRNTDVCALGGALEWRFEGLLQSGHGLGGGSMLWLGAPITGMSHVPRAPRGHTWGLHFLAPHLPGLGDLCQDGEQHQTPKSSPQGAKPKQSGAHTKAWGPGTGRLRANTTPQPAPTGPATLAPAGEPRGPGSPTRGHRAPVMTRSGPSWGQRRTSSSQLWGFRPVPSWKLPPPPRPVDRAAGLSSAAWKRLREPLRNRCMNT